MPDKHKRIIGVISGKGGVGKTTISVNLSAIAASVGQDVVLIDGDMGNPSVGLHLGMWQAETGLQDVLKGSSTIEDAVRIHAATGVRIILSTLRYDRTVKTSRFKEVMEKMKHQFAIVDSPPGINTQVEDLLSGCTEAVIVVAPDMPSCTSAVKICELAEEVGCKIGGLVVNRVQNRKWEMHPEEIESACDMRVLAQIPEDRIVPESIAARIPAVIYSPRSAFAGSMSRLAMEMDIGKVHLGMGYGRGGGGPFGSLRAFIKRIFGV